jgi:hypothetical protein
VIDLARELPFRNAIVVADSALRQGLVSRTQLRTVLHDCWTWPGIRAASRVIAFSDGRAEAVSESLARVIFVELGLPVPKLQIPIHDREGSIGSVDFLFSEHRTVVEVDGRVKYRENPDALFNEKRREDRIRSAGYELVRVTWDELQRPEIVLHKIRAAFARVASRAA